MKWFKRHPSKWGRMIEKLELYDYKTGFTDESEEEDRIFRDWARIVKHANRECAFDVLSECLEISNMPYDRRLWKAKTARELWFDPWLFPVIIGVPRTMDPNNNLSIGSWSTPARIGGPAPRRVMI